MLLKPNQTATMNLLQHERANIIIKTTDGREQSFDIISTNGHVSIYGEIIGDNINVNIGYGAFSPVIVFTNNDFVDITIEKISFTFLPKII